MRLSPSIRNSRLYRRIKLGLKRLVGRELRLRREVAVETRDFGDWTIAANMLKAGDIVYSLGVGNDVALDLALIDIYGVKVHAFDPTPSSVRWLDKLRLPASFNFHPWAVTANDGPIRLYPRPKRDGRANTNMLSVVAEPSLEQDAIDVQGLRLDTIMSRLGHRDVAMLKMDIEGAEYEVLDTMLSGDCRPRQLLVEFHHRFSSIGQKRTRDALAALHGAGYRIFAISATGREISMTLDPASGR